MSEATIEEKPKAKSKGKKKGKKATSKVLRHIWEFVKDTKSHSLYKCKRDKTEKRISTTGGARGGAKTEYRVKGGEWTETMPPVNLPN